MSFIPAGLCVDRKNNEGKDIQVLLNNKKKRKKKGIIKVNVVSVSIIPGAMGTASTIFAMNN